MNREKACWVRRASTQICDQSMSIRRTAQMFYDCLRTLSGRATFDLAIIIAEYLTESACLHPAPPDCPLLPWRLFRQPLSQNTPPPCSCIVRYLCFVRRKTCQRSCCEAAGRWRPWRRRTGGSWRTLELSDTTPTRCLRGMVNGKTLSAVATLVRFGKR